MDRSSRERAERDREVREQDVKDSAEANQQAVPGVYVEEISTLPANQAGMPETDQPAGFTDKFGSSVSGNVSDGIDVAAGETSNLYVQEVPSGLAAVAGEIQEEPGTSAYIGETEKNVSAQLDQAGQIDDVRSFDEADAIFGKRTEVKDSHDRFANLEVSHATDAGSSSFRPEIGDEVLLGRTGSVEVPADAAQAATAGSLAGNDNEWRAIQEQPQI